MNKSLLLVISLICFPLFSWGGDAFVVSGQGVGAENPTNDLRIFRWQKDKKNLKLEEKIEFPRTGIGGIYELGILHDQRLFAVIGGWSPELNKAPLTVLKFQKGKIIKQLYMFDLNRLFELYFHQSGKVALRLSHPWEWLLIDPEVENDKGEIITNKEFYWDELVGLHAFFQSLGDVNPAYLSIEPSGEAKHWFKKTSAQFALKDRLNGFFDNASGTIDIIRNTPSIMEMTMYDYNSEKDTVGLIIWDKIKDLWVYNWIPTMPPALVLAVGEFVVFQELKGIGNDQAQTGNFVFYNITKNDMFKAQVGQDSEVFDIDDEGWILYRAGDTLYKAQIQKDHLSEPVKLVTDPAITSVHWGLWAEDDPLAVGSEKVTSDMPVWQYLLIGIFLLIAVIMFVRGRRKRSDGQGD